MIILFEAMGFVTHIMTSLKFTFLRRVKATSSGACDCPTDCFFFNVVCEFTSKKLLLLLLIMVSWCRSSNS